MRVWLWRTGHTYTDDPANPLPGHPAGAWWWRESGGWWQAIPGRGESWRLWQAYLVGSVSEYPRLDCAREGV